MKSTNEIVGMSQEPLVEVSKVAASESGDSIRMDVVRISGFRGISNLELTLPRVTVLLGKNNSGKTSVLKALQLALGNYSRYLSDEDFFIGKNGKRQTEIIVDIRFIPVNGEVRAKKFSKDWQGVFGKNIRAEADKQFVGIRTIAKPDVLRSGDFAVERFPLGAWPRKENWKSAKPNTRNRLGGRLKFIPFVPIDAQRDIHKELSERSSFVGRILSDVEFNEDEVAKLEKMVAKINEEAVKGSEALKQLQGHLDKLNQPFESSGNSEITPFPKKIRDLSKRYGIYFGENKGESFSIEYHGMGTRSWASMLTVQALTELGAEKFKEEEKPFFPVLAAEEPEAHLHPNVQRTIFDQLKSQDGQVIVSTHSPYLAGMSDLECLRVLIRTPDSVQATQLIDGLDEKETKLLKREVMRLRGEILFSKALVLFEGVTEEQILSAMFQAYIQKPAHSLGINFIGVSGHGNYAAFVKMARSFGIPVCIISDNDGGTKQNVENLVGKLRQNISLEISDDNLYCAYHSESNDIEAEIINVLGLREEAISALIQMASVKNDLHEAGKRRNLHGKSNEDLISELRKCKASYAGFLADEILENPNGRSSDLLVLPAALEVFSKLAEWGITRAPENE